MGSILLLLACAQNRLDAYPEADPCLSWKVEDFMPGNVIKVYNRAASKCGRRLPSQKQWSPK